MDSMDDILKGLKGKRSKEQRIMAQMGYPAGYDADDNEITMRDLIQGTKKGILSFSQLQPKKLAAIAIGRIKAQQEFKVVILNKQLDKTSAIKEIEDGTDIGQTLVEIEKLAMQFALNAAMKMKAKGELKL